MPWVEICTSTEGIQPVAAIPQSYLAAAYMGGKVMGMDVFGRNPQDSTGEHFRISLWSWRPLHELVERLCGDLLDAKVIEGLRLGEGAGATDEDVCQEMARRFTKWIASHPKGYCMERSPSKRAAHDSRLVAEYELLGSLKLKTHPKYHVRHDILKEWIEFLEHCGGFEVW